MKPRPISLLIKPASSLCNMRCKYCFYADVSEHREVKSYGMMSLETLEILTQKALHSAEGFCSFAFQGGEPTLAGLKFYEQLLIFQKKYNTNNIKINNSIQTNGYIIDDRWAAFFAENHFLVGLSIDGSKEIHDNLRTGADREGTFKQVQRTAMLFDKYKVEYNILCVVSKLTARHPLKVYNALRKYKYLQFIPCIDSFNGTKHTYSLDSERYADFLKTTFDCYYNDYMNGNYVSVRAFDNYIGMLLGRPPESCGMSGVCTCYFVIEGDGSVFPCDFYVIDKYKLGNIRENTFTEMAAGNVARDFVDSSRYVYEDCRICKWRELCRGGCRRDREPFIGDNPGPNIYCNSYKDFFEYAYERMGDIAKRLR